MARSMAMTAPGLRERMSSAPVTASARMKPIMSVLMTAAAWSGASTNIQNTSNSVSKVSNGSRNWTRRRSKRLSLPLAIAHRPLSPSPHEGTGGDRHHCAVKGISCVLVTGGGFHLPVSAADFGA